MSKKIIEITGRPLAPIRIGGPALIRESDGVRQTSRVLHVIQHSQTETEFETENTWYRLHIGEVVCHERVQTGSL